VGGWVDEWVGVRVYVRIHKHAIATTVG